jgi:AraC family transcriptional regulator, activator of mtrCDE
MRIDKVPGTPAAKIPLQELDRLLSTLEVDFVRLTECLISPGWQLSFQPNQFPAIHYTLQGSGTFSVGDGFSIPIEPHSLVIVPPGQTYRMDNLVGQHLVDTLEYDASKWPPVVPGQVRRIVAGPNEPKMLIICGYFRASYGTSIELFSSHSRPIHENFDGNDQVDVKLRAALEELVAQEVGAGAMTASLMKQVLITIFRRSLSSQALWVERFSSLRDVQIARALAEMVARPGAPHTLQSLSEISGLSRSGFAERFTSVLGRAPMTALRELRLKHAAHLLRMEGQSIEQAANAAGYSSRSSFARAFRRAHGCDPSEYRKMAADKDPVR